MLGPAKACVKLAQVVTCFIFLLLLLGQLPIKGNKLLRSLGHRSNPLGALLY